MKLNRAAPIIPKGTSGTQEFMRKDLPDQERTIERQDLVCHGRSLENDLH